MVIESDPMNRRTEERELAKIGRARTIGVWVAILTMALSAAAQTRQGSQVENSKAVRKLIPVLRAAYAAFNRGDFDSAVAPLDPQIDWVEPTEFPGGGTYHGREAVKDYLKQSRDSWAEGSSEPERFITSRDHIVVFVYARFRAKDNDNKDWQEVRLADVYTIRNGKIVEMHAFANRQAALIWAGAKQ
jgi:ketosteroid isomerase-like protein